MYNTSTDVLRYELPKHAVFWYFINLKHFSSSFTSSASSCLFWYSSTLLNPRPHIQGRLSSASVQMLMTVHPTQAQRAPEVAEVTEVAEVSYFSRIQLPPYRLEATLLHAHYLSSSVTSAAVDSSAAGHQTAPAACNFLASLAAVASAWRVAS